eukprot:756852-Hanusia_phi.AAC.1
MSAVTLRNISKWKRMEKLAIMTMSCLRYDLTLPYRDKNPKTMAERKHMAAEDANMRHMKVLSLLF